MKIIIISPAPPYRGGIANHTACLYNELIKKHDVLIINYKKQYPNWLFPGTTQYNHTESSQKIPSERMIDSINPITWNHVVSKINNFKPDLVIFRYWNPFFAICLGYIANKINNNYKSIALCDNIIPHEKHIFYKLLTKFFLNRMQGFIVQSSIVEDELNSIIDNPKYVKLFHPIYDYLPAGIDKQKARNKLNINNEYILLFFGLVRDYKGLDILIKSAKYINRNLFNIKILAVGECYSQKEKYIDLIDKNGVNDIFSWEDMYVEDENINVYFSACDIVVLPYKSSSQSGIIPIAYHYNKPVITTNLKGMTDYIEDGKTGFIVEPNNPIQLSECIVDVINKNILNKMSITINKYKTRFNWESFCTGIEKFHDLI